MGIQQIRINGRRNNADVCDTILHYSVDTATELCECCETVREIATLHRVELQPVSDSLQFFEISLDEKAARQHFEALLQLETGIEVWEVAHG